MQFVPGNSGKKNLPAAIVLGLNVTGVATARSLWRKGVNVFGASLFVDDVGRYTRSCTVIDLNNLSAKPDEIMVWLKNFASKVGNRPVVFPANDKLALILSRYNSELAESCRLWTNSPDCLSAIIDKSQLYSVAHDAGLLVPPGTIFTSVEQISIWTDNNPPPYLVKPIYVGASESVRFKNKYFNDSNGLIKFLSLLKGETSKLVVQRVLKGGDGFIFDCYGLTDSSGRLLNVASHRRINQYPPDFGITCYGEIPALSLQKREKELFELTARLLKKIPYHGIFGIEWLLDKNTGDFYLLDFNARPFYTIGHLCDCGLNLPYLAYKELIGDDMSSLALTPKLKHKAWIDFWSFSSTFSRLRKQRGMSISYWFMALLKSQSHALWRWKDPGPAVYRNIQAGQVLLNKVFHGRE